MLTFAVSKNVDYSIPIVFSVYSQTATHKNPTITSFAQTPIIAKIKPNATAITKQTSTGAPKNTSVKASVQKTVAQPVANTTTIASTKAETKKEQSLGTSTTIKTVADVKKPKVETQPESKKIEAIAQPSEKIESKKIENVPVLIEKKEENKLAKALDVEQNVVPTPKIKKEEPVTKKDDVKKNEVKSEPETQMSGITNAVNTPIEAIRQSLAVPSEALCERWGDGGPNNAHVSSNFREVEALRRGAQLQKELVQKWQPPIGVAPDCSCELSFIVSKNGAVQQLKTTKSSGVLMFDISARQALCAMKMPQWTYGKPLIISFR